MTYNFFLLSYCSKTQIRVSSNIWFRSISSTHRQWVITLESACGPYNFHVKILSWPFATSIRWIFSAWFNSILSHSFPLYFCLCLVLNRYFMVFYSFRDLVFQNPAAAAASFVRGVQGISPKINFIREDFFSLCEWLRFAWIGVFCLFVNFLKWWGTRWICWFFLSFIELWAFWSFFFNFLIFFWAEFFEVKVAESYLL